MVFTNDRTMKKAPQTPSEILQAELEPLPAPVAPVPMPLLRGTELTPAGLAALAREVAMDMRELPDILKHYKLTDEGYAAVLKIPFYKHALDTALIEWNSSTTTPERIRLEAAATLEDAMPVLSARMKNSAEAFPAAIEAGKLFAKIAGLDALSKGEGPPGERFTITINLGADTTLKYEKEAPPILIEGTKNE